MKHLHLIGRRRRTLQWVLALLWFLPPWLGNKEFRAAHLDLGSASLVVVGQTYRLDEAWLLLPLTLALLLGGLLATMVLGRVWCGWGCHQTLLTDLVEGIAAQRPLLRPAVAVIVALATSLTLVWYFIPPDIFFPALLAGGLPPAAWFGIAIPAVLLSLDLVPAGRLLCRELCPYGRIQAALADSGTLTLAFPPAEAQRCLRCNACVRVCPLGVDIRQGGDIACINCGRCLDACREVMARRNQTGIIRYHFGSNGEGAGGLVNPRTVLVATLLLVVLLILPLARGRATDYPLTISRTPGSVARQIDPGHYLNVFTLTLSNRSDTELNAELKATTADGGAITLQGPGRQLTLAPHGHRQTTFTAVVPLTAGVEGHTLHFRLVAADGTLLGRAAATATPPLTGGVP